MFVKRATMMRSGILILGLHACITWACTLDYTPVCGSDGQTYSNECFLRAASTKNPSLTKAKDGQCDRNRHKRDIDFQDHEFSNQIAKRETNDSACLCPALFDPHCGTDGVTYPNKCTLECEKKNNPELETEHQGDCKDKDVGKEPQVCFCPDIYLPVCGTNKVTYPNACEANCNGVNVDYDGECDSERKTRSASDPCICTFLYMPVCGSDGRTYPNKCVLNCQQRIDSNLQLKHQAPCQERTKRSYPSCPCTREYDPLCASDGQTYNNPCLFRCVAKSLNIHVVRSGRCEKRNKRALQGLPCEIRCNSQQMFTRPICGSDGKTYLNPCQLECANAAAKSNPVFKSREIKRVRGGSCKEVPARNKRDIKNKHSKELLCACPRNLRPTCATNGQTYANPCLLECAAKADERIQYLHEGSCEERVLTPLCPCPRNLRKVCATNGKTYLNPCLLSCAAKANNNIKLLHDGPCNVRN